jgi:serine/threonine-protein kinase
MLEGTVEVSLRRAGSAEIGIASTRRRTTAAPRRRDLLARLSAMSLRELGHRLDGDRSEDEATAVARAWLDLVDDGRYAVSWTAAAPILRQTTGEEDWETALRSVRVPLGPCHGRTLHSQTTVNGFDGIPPGPYAVIRFESRFDGRPGVIETVTTCLGEDGRWRVAAYFVG